ncbi:helix-turn-helix transcriptional regulator [Sphingomonas baiyangensis]|uniref:WYL domain-containing protein n=1 Tax=Sphingomonas baiyangensis TaxID=2572576 RepID=A0A4U1L3E8_9SPHN|nr:WYL domain-containing protein [Sphingomonas baiyangensis]TKD51212.1 WYL domain-containing protein [Sphingomonas baiyangensis]
MRVVGRLKVSRRGFAAGLTGTLTALLPRNASVAAEGDGATLRDDRFLRDATLRGLARAGERGDPVLAEQAEAAIETLARTDPEAALLVRIYRRFEQDSPVFQPRHPASGPEFATALSVLHDAIADCREIGFAYTALDGVTSTRRVLPLVLVQPRQGIKLIAWCELRSDFRQFFVRSIANLRVEPVRFVGNRLGLLARLAEQEPFA